jgi:hypothetical protein
MVAFGPIGLEPAVDALVGCFFNFHEPWYFDLVFGYHPAGRQQT